MDQGHQLFEAAAEFNRLCKELEAIALSQPSAIKHEQLVALRIRLLILKREIAMYAPTYCPCAGRSKYHIISECSALYQTATDYIEAVKRFLKRETSL